MERRIPNSSKNGEAATASQSGGTGQRKPAWPVIATTILIIVIALMAQRLQVRSDDGIESGDSAFQSPLMIWKYALGDDVPLPTKSTTPGDLLVNGDMDQMGFYWRPPNHWIAGAWYEWFSTQPFNFPEFNDGYERGFYHTYPSSQRLQLWGDDYAGGLMQSATVTPCTYFQFQAYGQSRPGSDNPPPVDVASHMKVGIEPYGWMSGRSIYDYDPGLEPEAFPETVVWSPEATHNFEFTPYNVTAEALADTVTVILYSYPEIDISGEVYWNDTIWDTASLVQSAPPAGTHLDSTGTPEVDGLITNLRVNALSGVATIKWDTSEPASTQLRYRVVERTTAISTTEPLSHSVYLPVVTAVVDASTLNHYTTPDMTPVRQHQVVLAGLPESYAIDLIALSRRLKGGACVTSATDLYHSNSSGVGYLALLPILIRGK